VEKTFLHAGLLVEFLYLLVGLLSILVYLNEDHKPYPKVFRGLKLLAEFFRNLGVVLILAGLALHTLK